MKTTGTFRIYFVRRGAPLVWCVQLLDVPADPRDAPARLWEISVREVDCEGVRVGSFYRPKTTPDDEDGRPSAWFVTHGELEVMPDGRAVIRAVTA